MKEKWRESVNQGGAFGAILTDLSKAFDCLSRDLVIVYDVTLWLLSFHSYGQCV